MATVLKWKPRRSLLDLNAEEIERLTVERLKAYEVLRRINSDLAETRLERERLVRNERTPKGDKR